MIETSIVARLLGIRLLRLEATLVASPARMLIDDRVATCALPPPDRSMIRSHPIGARLAAAQRHIDEAATSLQALPATPTRRAAAGVATSEYVEARP